MLSRNFRRKVGSLKSKFNFDFKRMFRNRNFWLNFFKVALVLMGIGILGILGMFIYFGKDLPSPAKVVRRDGYSSKVYDRNGKVLYDIYNDAKRDPVNFSDIPDYLKKATISVEDKDFYKHKGFDPLTPLRMVKNVFYFKKVTGGSTLTQQLTRNVLLTTERTVTRKIK